MFRTPRSDLTTFVRAYLGINNNNDNNEIMNGTQYMVDSHF